MTEEQADKVEMLGIKSVPWILVLGDVGDGKTSLASTVADAFCFDTEDGAAIRYPEDHLHVLQWDKFMYENMVKEVDKIARNSTKKGKHLHWKKNADSTIQISAIVVDTFDMLQKALISHYLDQKPKPRYVKSDEIWAPMMEQRDWGIILNHQSALITTLKSMQIPVIWVCHTKFVAPQYSGFGERQKLLNTGSASLDVSGSISKWIVGLCTYALHITVGENGKRTIYTQPTVVEDVKLLAKDRYGLFRGHGRNWTKFPFEADKDGNPTTKVMKFILDNHDY